MDFFSEALKRLKHQLHVSKDREVAEALGLSATAFSERKKRSSFPERELVALAQRRPELRIDVNYVLTGESDRERAAQLVADTDAANAGATRRAREAGTLPPGAPPPQTREQLAIGTRFDPAWEMVFTLVYEGLIAHDRQVDSARDLLDLVDGTLRWLRLEEKGEIDREKARRKIEALL